MFIKHIPEDMTFNMVIYLYYVSDCLLNQIKYIRSMMNIIYLLRTLVLAPLFPDRGCILS
ncbi:hypothetical protein DOM12_26875 [Escherichia coli]|nr:hypothetical protein [Escherichia coli]